ncbi:MAG: hypothetical protein RL226_2046 [Bacteroidota bacterium]
MVLFDDHLRDVFLPLVYTRPIAQLRIGIQTIAEKWGLYTGFQPSYHTVPYLAKKYPCTHPQTSIWINGRLIPDARYLQDLQDLKPGEGWRLGDNIIAFRPASNHDYSGSLENMHRSVSFTEPPFEASMLNAITDLFSMNHEAIASDFRALTYGRMPNIPSSTNIIIGDPSLVFIEEGATVEGAFLNTTGGPIYVGAGAEIMEASVVRGPVAICEHATLKAGSKIYGATTIGPWCKVGGEVSNSIFFAYTNKGHDGFVGNSVLGEWCNLGADTNTSNLKNNYSKVKIWSYAQNGMVDTGLTFCGLIMGDHSKSGINTMFNTGTVTGVAANIFGGGFPDKFIPSFSWGGSDGFTTYDFDKAIETAERVLARRNQQLSDEDVTILRHIFIQSMEYKS